MGIQIIRERPEISTSTFRCRRLDRKSDSRFLRTDPGIQNEFETRRRQTHGREIRVHEQQKRGDFKPLLSRRFKSQGRTSIRAHGSASWKSREDEIRKAFVSTVHFLIATLQSFLFFISPRQSPPKDPQLKLSFSSSKPLFTNLMTRLTT